MKYWLFRQKQDSGRDSMLYTEYKKNLSIRVRFKLNIHNTNTQIIYTRMCKKHIQILEKERIGKTNDKLRDGRMI